jgi:hypothetical protein
MPQRLRASMTPRSQRPYDGAGLGTGIPNALKRLVFAWSAE